MTRDDCLALGFMRAANLAEQPSKHETPNTKHIETRLSPSPWNTVPAISQESDHSSLNILSMASIKLIRSNGLEKIWV
jgi:hypothetical protein